VPGIVVDAPELRRSEQQKNASQRNVFCGSHELVFHLIRGMQCCAAMTNQQTRSLNNP
jgi:hypothetical protein